MLSLLAFASTSTIDTLSASVQGPVALDRCYVWGILTQRVFSIFIFSHFITEYVVPGAIPVCASVRLSVRPFYLNTIGPISMKLGPHDLNKNLRWDFSQILEMLPQWRHNGFFDVLRWGTLTPSIFVQFSSNWHMLLFISWLCMGLQSSVFGSYLLSEMTVGKTVKNLKKNESDVKF